jgi:hypothetical protein
VVGGVARVVCAEEDREEERAGGGGGGGGGGRGGGELAVEDGEAESAGVATEATVEDVRPASMVRVIRRRGDRWIM